MPYTSELLDINGTDIANVGGKGAGLGRLARIAGVRVPPGFCVTTQAYDLALATLLAAMDATAWLNERLEAWLGERGAADALTQSVPHNVTSEMGLALLDVSDAVRPHPSVVAVLEQVEARGAVGDGLLDELAALPGGGGAAASSGSSTSRAKRSARGLPAVRPTAARCKSRLTGIGVVGTSFGAAARAAFRGPSWPASARW